MPEPDEAGPTPVVVDGARFSAPRSIVGEVRRFRQSTEPYGNNASRSVWTFRVERYDPSGNRLPPVPVEMRGLRFDGSLADGDQVEVSGKWDDGTLRAKRVRDLTTGAIVKVKSYKTALIIALIAFVIIASAIAGFAIKSSREFNEEFRRNERQFNDQIDQSRANFNQQVDESRRLFCENAAGTGVTPPGC